MHKKYRMGTYFDYHSDLGLCVGANEGCACAYGTVHFLLVSVWSRCRNVAICRLGVPNRMAEKAILETFGRHRYFANRDCIFTGDVCLTVCRSGQIFRFAVFDADMEQLDRKSVV